MDKLEKYIGEAKRTNDDVNFTEYKNAVIKQLMAYNKFDDDYRAQNQAIFMNKGGETASKKFIKVRDEIVTLKQKLENKMVEHYSMAKKLAG